MVIVPKLCQGWGHREGIGTQDQREPEIKSCEGTAKAVGESAAVRETGATLSHPAAEGTPP